VIEEYDEDATETESEDSERDDYANSSESEADAESKLGTLSIYSSCCIFTICLEAFFNSLHAKPLS
jgi:hypothetical protein